MTLNKNITEEDIINSFVEQILSEDTDFQFMSEDEQAKIYGIYQLLLTAVHRALAHDNVYPVVYANDYNSNNETMEDNCHEESNVQCAQQ